jgi:peptide/nickel transport system permease protein
MNRLIHFVGSLLLAAWMAAMLISWAPGAGIREEAFGTNTPVFEDSERSVSRVLLTTLRGVVRGDLGHSPVFNRPVRELLVERVPVTAGSVIAASILAWMAGLPLALLGLGSRCWRWPSAALATLLAATPAAVLALGCAVLEWPSVLAMAAVLLPKVYTFSSEIVERGAHAPYRAAAIARGLTPARVLWSHLLRPAWPELRAVAQVLLPAAFGAAIPVEVFTSTPGLGELAWKAATGRDVMLLMNVTLLLTALTLLVSARSRAEAAHGA